MNDIPRTPWALFFSCVAADRSLATKMGLAALGVAACELSLPYLISVAVDAALGDQDPAMLDRAGLAMLAIAASLYFVHVAYLRTEAGVLYAAVFRLRRLLYARVFDQPVSYFAQTRAGDLTHIVINDVEVVETHGAYIFSEIPFALLTIAGVLTIMAFTDWHLTLMIVGFLTAASLISAWLGRPLPTIRRTIQKLGATLSQRYSEGISGVRTVKAFGHAAHEVGLLDAASRAEIDQEIREAKIGAKIAPVLELMEMLGVVLIVWYGAHLVLDDVITAGTLVAFIAYMELISEPVSRAGRYYRHFLACKGVLHRISDFLNGLPVAPASLDARPAPAVPDSVEFRNVSFAYPDSRGPACHDVSFVARPGEIVCIAGPNGAGKSTLMNLLLKFWTPASGEIRVGGVPFAEWPEPAWRDTTGVMLQDVFLFHATLAENIAYGRLDASRAEIDQAARKAGLGPLLDRLPDGLDTPVGDRGQKLSGGERQRVSLARMLLKDPKVLIFDEPSAGLDRASIAHLGAAIVELAKDRIVFVIAHNAETIAIAHRVLAMDQGRLVADTTPGGLAELPEHARLLPAATPPPRGRG